MTVVKQDKKRESKFKAFMKESKRIGQKVVSGIETTARIAGKAAEMIEPFIDAAAAANPELAPILGPLALGDTAMAEANRLIEHSTSKRGAGSYKALTDTSKYQKMTGDMAPPKVNLIDYAPYPPMPPKLSQKEMSQIMDID